MIDVEATINIDRPVGEVFAYVQDENNIPKWDPDLLKATKTSSGLIGKGTTYHLDIKPFMGETKGSGEVVAYEPNRRIELQFVIGKLKPHVFHLFEPAGSGTKFTRRVEMQPSGFMRLMSPLMRSMMKKKNVAYLSTLKRLVES
jgi:uncharacterized protein YndB with AHSA1/START domain